MADIPHSIGLSLRACKPLYQAAFENPLKSLSGVTTLRGACLERRRGRYAWILHVSRNARRYPGRRRLHRLPRKVGIPSRRLHLPVPQQLPDHRQTFAQGQRSRSKGMTEVVDPHVFQPGPLPNQTPRGVEVAQMPVRFRSRNHPRIVQLAGQCGQHLPGRRRQRHRPRSGLGVPQPQLSRLQVHVLPAKSQYLVPPDTRSASAAGEPLLRSATPCPRLPLRSVPFRVGGTPPPTETARNSGSCTSSRTGTGSLPLAPLPRPPPCGRAARVCPPRGSPCSASCGGGNEEPPRPPARLPPKARSRTPAGGTWSGYSGTLRPWCACSVRLHAPSDTAPPTPRSSVRRLTVIRRSCGPAPFLP